MHLTWRGVAPGNGPAISTSITPKETEELQRLAFQSDVLEIGAAFGYSAVSMALAGAHVTSVDPHLVHGSLGAMQSNLSDYGVSDRVDIWCAYSQDALPEIAKGVRRFDVVFIDGDHTMPGVVHDITWAMKLLKPGGVMACHDYRETCCCPGVAEAIDSLFSGPLRMVDTMYVVKP